MNGGTHDAQGHDPHAHPRGAPLELPGRGTTWVHDVVHGAAGPGDPADPRHQADRPTVFLLHGWTATAALNWFPAYQPLSTRYRVVAIDHRGHGRGIRTSKRFRLDDCADDVAATADALGIERFIPVGYSMGGPIAQLVWKRHRERVEGLVLCATASHFRGRPGESVLFGVMGGLSVAARLTPERWRRHVNDRMIDGRFDDSPGGRWADEEMRGHDPRMIVEAGVAIGNFDSRPWIGEVDVPTSVLVTRFDAVVPRNRQERLAAAIPGATRHELRGDHDVCVTRPEAFIPTLVEAVDHVAARARQPASTAA